MRGRVPRSCWRSPDRGGVWNLREPSRSHPPSRTSLSRHGCASVRRCAQRRDAEEGRDRGPPALAVPTESRALTRRRGARRLYHLKKKDGGHPITSGAVEAPFYRLWGDVDPGPPGEII